MKRTEFPGLRFPDAMTLLFIGLKLSDHITWSWIYVILPSIIAIVARLIWTLAEDRK